VRGLVIHGAGRHFSAGADLPEMRAGLQQDAGRWRAHLLEATRHLERLSQLPYPVVAAISGCCLGSALELALACTRRVAAANAVFALPESTFGLLPGCGGTVRLPRLVGAGRAAELILSGRTFGAAEALEWGVVARVTTRERLLPEALQSLEDGCASC
jgi:enoyl-CoA hydratase/carnithine racemase